MLEAISASLLLFLIMDPVGNVPVFACVLSNVRPSRRRKIILRELLIALAVLLIFLFAGRYILVLLKVSQSSLGIGGGIILFLIAVRMIFSGSAELFKGTADEEPLIVPLAIPLISGPSAMTAVILLMAKEPGRWCEWLCALLAAWAVSGMILLFSDPLTRILGRKVLLAVERLMGMILTIVAVEMLVTGIKTAFFV